MGGEEEGGELMAELRAIVSRWYHKRDRMIYIDPNTGHQEVIYDSGCVDCWKCEVEEWIKKWEGRVA